jgi:hypothetical protein
MDILKSLNEIIKIQDSFLLDFFTLIAINFLSSKPQSFE